MRLLALCLALLAGSASAREVEGVEVAESIPLGGTELRLNGAGVRRATIFNVKVYVGALYLATPARDPEAIVRSDEPKRVRMRFLRDVSRGKAMDAFREGFEKNVGARAAALRPDLDRVAGKPFADAMFRCWLGVHPADDDLKRAMLGPEGRHGHRR
jgi:hypothetical protein